MLRFIVFMLVSAVASRALGQSAITLSIINGSTKTPLAGISVHHPDFSFIAVSNELGQVTLNNFQGNELQFSGIGFKPRSILLSQLPANNIIELEPSITSLKEVTVSANARTGIFHTISDLDIHVRPIINSQEVLRIVPGLFIGQHAGGGKAEQIFLRGFDIDHGTDISITVDGMPVNMVSHAHGQGYADLHFVIPELIEKVNFNKGPYFTDRGNFATAGYVDFRTKDYLDKSFVKTEVGQFDSYRAAAGINLLQKRTRQQNNQSFFVAGEASFTKGYFDSPQDFNRFNVLLKYHGRLNKRTSLSSYVSAFTSKWNASGQIPDRAVESRLIGWYGAIDDTEGGKTSRYNINNVLTTHLGKGTRWKNQLYYTRYLFELYSNFTFFLENPADGDQIKQKEARHLFGYMSEIQKDHTITGKSSVFSAGLQSRYDLTQNSELSNTKNRALTLRPIMNGDINELNLAVYAEEKIHFSPALTVTAGIRGDYFGNRYKDRLAKQTLSSNSMIISPKLNLTYSLSPTVQLYWYNGQGFHSNDTRVAVQQRGREVVTPAWGSDIGGIVKLGNKAVLQSAIWYLWLKQEFVYVGDAGVVEPGGKTQRMGWDASLRYEIIRSLYADIDINYTHPKALNVPKEESNLPLAPKFTSTGGITYRRQTGINGSLRYRYMGDRPANEDNSVEAKGYFICDAAINYTRPRWELGLSLQNVFNTRWKETQFDTESRLQNEPQPVSEIHFTPGTPFFARLSWAVFF